MGGAILTRGCTCQEAAYQHWKRFVDKLWEDKHHCHQAVACQRLLNKHAAHEQQENACRHQLVNKIAAQCLLDKRATHKRQTKYLRDRAKQDLHKQAAIMQAYNKGLCIMRKCQKAAQRNAQAWRKAAAHTILLWLCRRLLHIRLTWMTTQQQ
jgi:hypothetical protein